MASVILIIDWESYADDKIEDVRVMENDAGDVWIFSSMEDADEWIEENHKIGQGYHIAEL